MIDKKRGISIKMGNELKILRLGKEYIVTWSDNSESTYKSMADLLKAIKSEFINN